MDVAQSAIHDVVHKLRSWIPRKPQPSAMSRDFWMPDSSCRVCYECDSQFNLFNRRHHCRICGRVFCGKCTQNTLSPSLDARGSLHEEAERVRVCNFCFKSALLNAARPSTPTLTPSSSSRSLASTTTTGSSTTSSSGYPGTFSPGFGCRGRRQTVGLDLLSDKEQRIMIPSATRNNISLSPKQRGSSPNPYDFCNNRSDDDDDNKKQAGYRNARAYEMHAPYQDEEEYRSCAGINLADAAQKDQSNFLEHHIMTAVDTSEEGNSTKIAAQTESSCENTGNEERTLPRSAMSSEEYDCPDETIEDGKFYTPLYQEGAYQVPSQEGDQPVDIENNHLIWVPPLPEDEEDETVFSMVDEDDDYEVGGWGLPRSCGSGECKSREKAASDEQRKAMRAVVDGHFRALVTQLLNGEGIPAEEGDKESWLEIVTALALEAGSLVKPDTSKGGGMDPGGYVKVKCIATGRRSESYVVKGVICKKNVAHKRMAPQYKNPRLLLLGGALEYQRVSNQLSSIDTLLQQETDHLSMTVARIEAHHPNVLLVEKTVSRDAQERLLAKKISLVLNVKRPLLERIARCTGALIVPTPDNLVTLKAGHCECFHVEKYLEEHGSADPGGKKSSKTLMFFEGCPKPLGCTVLLKGANGDELKKVKRVIQFAVFAAYHLALETSFLADEGASLPDLTLKSPIGVALPDKQSRLDRSISTIPGFVGPTSGQTQVGDPKTQVQSVPQLNLTVSSVNSFNNALRSASKAYGALATVPVSPASSSLSSTRNSFGTSPLSSDAFTIGAITKLFPTSPLNSNQHNKTDTPFSGGSQEVESVPLSGYQRHLSVKLRKDSLETLSVSTIAGVVPPLSMVTPSKPSTYDINSGLVAAPSLIITASPNSSSLRPSEECRVEGSVASGLALLNPDTHIYHEPQLAYQMDNQEFSQCEHQESNQEDFPPSPSDHQSILVSRSSSCLKKGAVCERGHLFRIKYYGSFDKPLGRFLRDDLFDLYKRCTFCDELIDAHVYCYTHRQASLTMSVKHQNQILPGEKEGKIWMWHRCLKCTRVNCVPPATRRLVMSDAAWGLSFGKFLELNFSNHAAASRVAACGHSLHRDCIRFYGFGSMVACFRYAPINVHSVYLPPCKLEFNNPEQQGWLENEVREVTELGDIVFVEAFDTLRQIGEKVARYGSGKVPEARRHIADLEALLQREKAGFEETLLKAAPMKYQPGRPIADILELSRLRSALSICSTEWVNRLSSLASSLKLPIPITGSDSILFDDPSVSFTKDDSSGTTTDRPDNGRGMVCTSVDNNCDISSTMKSHSTVASINGGLPSDVGQQPWDLCAKTQLKKDELVAADGDDSNNHTFVNRLLDTHGEHVSAEKYIVDGYLSEKESTSMLEDRETATVRKTTDPLSCALGSMKENTCPLAEGDIGVRRTLSEGHFPILTDLSDTFEAAWTGKGQSVEAHAVHIAPNGQEICPYLDIPDVSVASNEFVDGNDVVGPDTEHSLAKKPASTKERAAGGPDFPLASNPMSPAKAAEVLDELGGSVGAPFSTLYSSYSRGSYRSLTRSPLVAESQRLSGLPSIISHTGQVAAQEAAVVPIYNDEPTSIIAYAIVSKEYQAHLSDGPVEKDKQEKKRVRERESDDLSSSVGAASHPLQFLEAPPEQSGLKDRPNKSYDNLLASSKDAVASDPLLHCKAMHIKVSFTCDGPQGNMKYTVTCYYAKQFDALRKKCCPSEMEFVRSLCRCKKWGAQGGKSNVFFAKTSDDRFVIKQVTKTELESFIKFAPEYFKYHSDALNSGSPTCLAKILGIFQVTLKHGKGGKEVRMDLMAMENLLYGRHVTRIYDLKGSARSRYNADATGANKILLDQNLLESMQNNPIFIGNKAKRLLERAVWNDTSFLASVDVMDYSLLVGVDEERRELVLGIIDFVRQYTWDKHLETWVKASGILGGPKNTSPTVISPKQYKKRFRKAMSTYFLMVPDQWSPPTMISGPELSDAPDETLSVATQDEACGGCYELESVAFSKDLY